MNLIRRLLHVVLTPADDGSLTIPALNCADRQMCCSQSRTAGSVKVEGGSCNIKSVGHSIRKCVSPRPNTTVVCAVLARQGCQGILENKDSEVSHLRRGFRNGPSSEGANFTPSVIDARIKECEE